MQLSSWIQFLHLRPKECNKNGWSETKFCISNDKWHQVGCKTKWNYWSDNSTPPCSDGQQYRWIFFYHLPQWSPSSTPLTFQHPAVSLYTSTSYPKVTKYTPNPKHKPDIPRFLWLATFLWLSDQDLVTKYTRCLANYHPNPHFR